MYCKRFLHTIKILINKSSRNSCIYFYYILQFSPEIQRLHDMYMRQQEIECDKNLQKINENSPPPYLGYPLPYPSPISPVQAPPSKKIR